MFYFCRQQEELVQSCRRIVQEKLHWDSTEFSSPGYLSLVCELAVLPHTYDVILSLINETVHHQNQDVAQAEVDQEDEFLEYHHDILNWNVSNTGGNNYE